MELLQKREAIVRDYIDAYNRKDVEAMTLHLHPQVVFEHCSGGETTLRLLGIGAFREQATRAAALFEERYQAIERLEAQDNTVEVAIRYRGTVVQDLPDGTRRGETLELEGRSVFEFQGEEIIGLRDETV